MGDVFLDHCTRDLD